VDFEWDLAKADSNLAKHGIDFAEAMEVLGDPERVERPDPRSRAEPRVQVIGAAKGRILFAVYTMRGADCRIISIRRANRRERKAYPVSSGN
jgi:uncharacterized DUF497 family protein